MKKHASPSLRFASLLLVLALLLLPAAQALTTDQARELLSTYYIDPVSDSVLDQPTIEDMIDALGDPYTQYFTPEEYADFTSSMLDTNLVGIGIVSQNSGSGLVLNSVVPGSPAEQGGLQPGDVVTAIDGHSTIGVATGTVSGWLTGEKGTAVNVTYQRNGEDHTVTLTRAEIIIPAAETELQDGHIGYMKCTTFGADTPGHIREGVKENDSKVDHWIFDLRENGGGVINDAVQSAAVFAGSGLSGYLRDGTGAYGALGSEEGALTISPVIVLTSPNTASASEMFASIIRDQKAGISVGGRTYGKGVAQSVFDKSSNPDYFADGSGMKITSLRFFAANGAATDTVGVIPHLLVDPTIASQVAHLLSDSGPTRDTKGYLRLDFGWHWYINLDSALSEENRPALTALLEAIPSNIKLWEGTGGTDGWSQVSPADVASVHKLDYQSRGFSDSATSPYGEAIDILGTYGLVSGSGNGAFSPDGTLTRAQLCALLAQAMNCKAYTGESHFSDVPMDTWYGSAVNAMASLGLVSGVGNGRFDPDAPVDHQQFITVMGRASQRLNAFVKQIQETRPADALSDPALSPYADWAKDSVWLFTQSQQNILGSPINLLWDDLDSIDPAATTTRGEAAALLYSAFSYIGILPV